jgi:hypothetical protein
VHGACDVCFGTGGVMVNREELRQRTRDATNRLAACIAQSQALMAQTDALIARSNCTLADVTAALEHPHARQSGQQNPQPTAQSEQ